MRNCQCFESIIVCRAIQNLNSSRAWQQQSRACHWLSWVCHRQSWVCQRQSWACWRGFGQFGEKWSYRKWRQLFSSGSDHWPAIESAVIIGIFAETIGSTIGQKCCLNGGIIGGIKPHSIWRAMVVVAIRKKWFHLNFFYHSSNLHYDIDGVACNSIIVICYMEIPDHVSGYITLLTGRKTIWILHITFAEGGNRTRTVCTASEVMSRKNKNNT